MEHNPIWICHVVPKMNVTTLLAMQIIGVIKEHEVIIQWDSAMPNTASVTKHFLVQNISMLLRHEMLPKEYLKEELKCVCNALSTT